MSWIPVIFGAVVLLGLLGAVLLVRAWPSRRGLSSEERAEMAGAPMPPLQRRAWWSLLVGVATLGATSAILVRHGATAYWENDDLSSLVVAIFIGGMVAYAGVLSLNVFGGDRKGGLDERDRLILSRAPAVQSAVVLIALAAWVVSLAQRFHEQGVVPVVYLYLIIGSIIIVNIIGQSLGILLGYWIGSGRGEG